MTQIAIDQIKNKVLPILSSADVLKAAIFGSYVRGDQRENSDIDILVEFPKGKSLLDLVDLEMKLEEVLGKKVDLVTYKSVSPYLKDYIQRDQIQIL